MKLKIPFLIGMILSLPAFPQDVVTLNLRKATELAIDQNHLLNIREYQVEEKESKVAESRIKGLPSVITSSTWQYNKNLGELVIGAGSLGTLPLNQQLMIPLPLEDLRFGLSKHKNFNMGITLYQPITQLAKIKAGVELSKTELRMAGKEKDKAIQLISMAVEKLYYGLLINQKLQEEAEIKVELSRIRLRDLESALKAGKTIDVNKSGLLANLADEEQNQLKTEIQAEDYWADFKTLTGITSEKIILEKIEADPAADYAEKGNPSGEIENKELELALLGEKKAFQGLRAAYWGYLPDIGFLAGYSYQKGNKIYPEQNPFVGANFKWNLQDVFFNREIVHQRQSQLLQAKELVALTDKQVKSDIEKTERKLIQAKALIAVVQKAVQYRAEDLTIQQEKLTNGLTTLSEVLNTKALLTKAEADLLASRLNYRIISAELKLLLSE